MLASWALEGRVLNFKSQVLSNLVRNRSGVTVAPKAVEQDLPIPSRGSKLEQPVPENRALLSKQ